MANTKPRVGTIEIELKRSLIGCNPKQRATMLGLGLKHRHQRRVLENTPCVRGMIKRVIHLVELVGESK
jgi:large subunit ribosomal protein L30